MVCFFCVAQTFLSRRRIFEVNGILPGSVLQVTSPAVVDSRTMALSKCDECLDPSSAHIFLHDLGYNRSGILI